MILVACALPVFEAFILFSVWISLDTSKSLHELWR